MKKVLGLTLALILLLSITSFCYAEYDEEFLFRSIPWKLSYEETISQLKEIGSFTFDKPVDYKYGDKELAVGFRVIATPRNMSVAGNRIKSIEMVFVLAVNPEDNSLLSKDKAMLALAKYVFESDTKAMAIEEDLIEKLCSLYGDYDKQYHWDFANDYENTKTWYGKNDSSLVLYHHYTEPFMIKAMASDELMLTYRYGKMDELLSQSYDCIVKPANNNTDGL